MAAVAAVTVFSGCGETSTERRSREAARLVERGSAALAGASRIAYDFTVRGDGPYAEALAGASGRVVMERLPGGERGFRARIEARRPRQPGEIVVVRDADTVRALDAESGVVWEAPLFAGGSRLLEPVQAALLYEFVDPQNLSAAAAEAEAGALEGGAEARCRPLTVTAEGGGTLTWCLGAGDGLPRRRTVRSPAGEVTLELSGLELEPELQAGTFRLEPPAGVGVERLPVGPAPGSPAPAFDLPAEDGGRVALEALAGSVVVLDFWATWCRPCMPSLEALAELRREMAGRPLAIYAVNARESGDAEGFLGGLGIDLPVLTGGDDLLEAVSGGTLPAFAVIDADGRIAGVGVGWFGAGSERYLLSLVEAALAAAGSEVAPDP